MVVIDASVVLRWFVEQEGFEDALGWLERFVENPDILIAPDLLRFEVHGALARLAPKRNDGWSQRSFARFDRLGIRMVNTDAELFDRALSLSLELGIAGYDAVYVAHAEALNVPWLTADAKVLRQLEGDPRIQALRQRG